MVKRKNKGVVDASENSLNGSEISDIDSEMLNLDKKSKSSHSSELTSPIESDESDYENVLQKPTAANKNRKRRVNCDSEPEEGELTDTDSSSDVSQEEFNDGYDTDLMGDEEDRQRLAQMTEKEREQEIFKRIEAREVMRTRFNIEKKLKQAKKQELKKQKHSMTSGYNNYKKELSLELKERVLERKKTVEENRGKSSDKKFQAMNMLKARRVEKREREEKEKQMKIEQEKQKQYEQISKEVNELEIPSRSHKTKLKASDVYSDDSGSISAEEAFPKPTITTTKVSSSSSSSSDSDIEARFCSNRTRYIATNEQLNSIRLSRYKLEQFVHLPIFKKVAIGSFVRLTIGSSNNRPVYRICQVSDVCEMPKIYQLGNTRTNKQLRCRFGPHEKTFRMEYVSNQEFTGIEFDRWRETCENEGVSVPTVEELENKIKDIQDALAYEFREEDVEKIVKEKERLKTTPYNYAMKKTQLMKERDMAQSIGNTEKLMELQDQLNQLEQRANELDRLRTSSISSISYINNRNRRKNVEEAEKAILAELRASKGQRADDPFTRRHTKPSMVTKAKRVDEKLVIAEQKNRLDDVGNDVAEKQQNSNETKKINPQKNGEDMYAAHDFEINIDVPIIISPTASAPAPVILQSSAANKSRSLNLEDYKRRKGFI